MTRREKMVYALSEIRRMAKDHPAFYEEAFDNRDVDLLMKEGGDIFDWTIIAILADDALQKDEP